MKTEVLTFDKTQTQLDDTEILNAYRVKIFGIVERSGIYRIVRRNRQYGFAHFQDERPTLYFKDVALVPENPEYTKDIAELAQISMDIHPAVRWVDIEQYNEA